MSILSLNKAADAEIADPRWQDLYRLGGISSILLAAFVTAAIIAFFIWPFKPGFTSTENIFLTLQQNRLGGLMSLDLPMILIAPLNILPFLAMYVVLKRVNESYALIALVLALIAITVLIPTRPLAELVWLSEKYAAAITEAEKNQYLAAGESLHALFNGTAWIAQTIFFILSGLINCWLMLHTVLFRKITAIVGIVTSVIGIGFMVPVFGPAFLLLNTVGSVIWFILLGQDFLGLRRQFQVLPK